MKKISSLLTLSAIILSTSVVAPCAELLHETSLTTMERTIAPSPEASSLAASATVNINYSTATAQVEVPLISLSVGEYPLSLSLTYQTGGIRVRDEAGRVGLGWTLCGLGSVSRSVVGMPDSADFSVRTDLNEAGNDFYSLQSVFENSLETSAVRFNYSVPGHSGSFLISNERIIKLTDDDSQITYDVSRNGTSIMAFHVLTPEGIRYDMGGCEEVTVVEGGVHLGATKPMEYTAVVEWLTDRIALPCGDEIAVSYAKGQTWKRASPVKVNALTANLNLGNGSGYTTSHNFGPEGFSGTIFLTPRYPVKIECPTGLITMTYETDPPDSRSLNERLKEVTLQNSKGR